MLTDAKIRALYATTYHGARAEFRLAGIVRGPGGVYGASSGPHSVNVFWFGAESVGLAPGLASSSVREAMALARLLAATDRDGEHQRRVVEALSERVPEVVGRAQRLLLRGMRRMSLSMALGPGDVEVLCDVVRRALPRDLWPLCHFASAPADLFREKVVGAVLGWLGAGGHVEALRALGDAAFVEAPKRRSATPGSGRHEAP